VTRVLWIAKMPCVGVRMLLPFLLVSAGALVPVSTVAGWLFALALRVFALAARLCDAGCVWCA
jgi:hypothetical protein